MKKLLYPIISAVILAGCSSTSQDYQQTEKGVVVKVRKTDAQTPSLVRIEPKGDKIIRVSATKDQTFKDPQSLAVVDQKCKPEYRVEQSGDTVKVITNALKANVLTSTGKVFFTDLDGKITIS